MSDLLPDKKLCNKCEHYKNGCCFLVVEQKERARAKVHSSALSMDIKTLLDRVKFGHIKVKSKGKWYVPDKCVYYLEQLLSGQAK